MKITIEFDSLEEMDAFRGEQTAAPAALSETSLTQGEPELTPQQKAARTRAANKAKKEQAAAAAAAQAPEPEPVPEREPEPEPEPEPTNVTPIKEPDPEPQPGVVPEVEAVAEKFRDLVSRDYPGAAQILNNLGCETFSEVVEQNKLGDLSAALG